MLSPINPQNEQKSPSEKSSKKLFDLPVDVLLKTEQTISKYKLFKPAQDVIVAFSGGKDSLFTMLVLRELGYSVFPVIIDMGYEKDWGPRIIELAKAIGFENAEAVYARDSQIQQTMAMHAFEKVKTNIETLNTLDFLVNRNITPCTFCYNTKAILLENFAMQNGIDTVIFGQHAIDAIASMLKLAFMYIDRWDGNNETFSHSRFSELVEKIIPDLTLPYEQAIKTPIFKRIAQLCKELLAATDDPPHQRLNTSFGDIKLVRPIFRIRESVIRRYVKEKALQTEGSGCGHGATKETQTPREMIQYRLLKVIDEENDDERLLDALMDLVELGLSSEGQLIFNVRNAREKLLGKSYKDVGPCSTQKA